MICGKSSARGQKGLTLIELLIALVIVGILAAIAVPTYLGFVQRARETSVIYYLAEFHKGQQVWRLEIDSLGYSGDFDELEESGFIPDAVNFARVRRRPPRRGVTRTTSSRVVQNYRLDLTAVENPSTNSYAYTISAYPVNRSTRVRWFYLDQTGMIRAATGSAGPRSPAAS